MDDDPLGPALLSTHLRGTALEPRVAALLYDALAEELSVERLRDQDPAAGGQLAALLRGPAERAAHQAVSKLVFDLLEALADQPALRGRLSGLPPTARAGEPVPMAR